MHLVRGTPGELRICGLVLTLTAWGFNLGLTQRSIQRNPRPRSSAPVEPVLYDIANCGPYCPVVICLKSLKQPLVDNFLDFVVE